MVSPFHYWWLYNYLLLLNRVNVFLFIPRCTFWKHCSVLENSLWLLFLFIFLCFFCDFCYIKHKASIQSKCLLDSHSRQSKYYEEACPGWGGPLHCFSPLCQLLTGYLSLHGSLPCSFSSQSTNLALLNSPVPPPIFPCFCPVLEVESRALFMLDTTELYSKASPHFL